MVLGRRRSRTVRIDADLDSQIRDLAAKNNLSFTQASREMAEMNKKMRGAKIRREIIF